MLVPLQDVFGGAQGPVADALNLNAGVALAAANVAGDAKEGVAMAQEAQRRCDGGLRSCKVNKLPPGPCAALAPSLRPYRLHLCCASAAPAC